MFVLFVNVLHELVRLVATRDLIRDLITKTVNLKLKLGYYNYRRNLKYYNYRRNLKFFKGTYCQKYSVIFLMSEWEGMLFAKSKLQTTKWKNTKTNCKTTRGAPSQIWPFPGVIIMFYILVNPFNVNVVGDGYPVRQPIATNSSAVDMRLTEMQEDLALTNFNQGHSTVNFWRQVPESKYPEFKRPVKWLISLFSTTYCCAFLFSNFKYVKSNHRAILKMDTWEN